jgi:uncharacterized membrane protein
MKAAVALVLITLISGCGEGEPVANQAQNQARNQAQNQPAPQMAAPITHNETATETIVEDSSPPVVVRKPLVSRGTSTAQNGPFDYRAIGTEPFWAVTVRGSTATLERPDRQSARFAVSRSDDAKAIRYVGDGFAMTLTEGPCSDGMSDAVWSDRVQIAFGEGTLKGCGGVREDDRREALP